MQIWKPANIFVFIRKQCVKDFTLKHLLLFEISAHEICEVCLQTFRNNRICKKLAYFLRNLQTSRANNSRIVRIKNAKFSGYCFYMNKNIHGDFQICISVPLMQDSEFHKRRLQWSWSSTYLRYKQDFLMMGVERYFYNYFL